MSPRQLIITHHAPDLDAVTAVWLLKRFDPQNYADAQVAFVNPQEKISAPEAQEHGYDLHQTTYVDTGWGEFDHHQPARAKNNQISATSLVYDYVCKQKPSLKDDQALKTIAEFATAVDHFQEVNWPKADSTRYVFMIHHLLRGHEFTDPHNDDSQLHFGLKTLDCAYAALKQHHKAIEILQKKGLEFQIKAGKCLGLATRNDDTLKLAQKQGYALVLRKDTDQGHIRIKAHPDSDLNLKKLYQAITKLDQQGTWFYHGSGKMLLNGSSRHRDQQPSPLSLNTVINLIKEHYG
ncbi:MAG: hypothetical protein GF390_00240 [Candidatus Pacebacteria bacterium]|nr:hypothetical protein [Candidatus Paceibacterota bacterium]